MMFVPECLLEDAMLNHQKPNDKSETAFPKNLESLRKSSHKRVHFPNQQCVPSTGSTRAIVL